MLISNKQIVHAKESKIVFDDINTEKLKDIEFSKLTDDEKILVVAKRVLKRHIKAFRSLTNS